MFDTYELNNHRSRPMAELVHVPMQPRRELASASHVRKVLFASASRLRNLSVVASSSASAMVMLGLGMTWSGLGMLSLGAILYACLIARDSISDKFLSRVFSISTEPTVEAPALTSGGPIALPVEGLDDKTRAAYEGVLKRRAQLQEQFRTGPAVLQASLPEGIRICDTLLSHAQRLVLRGQRLHAYLDRTRLTELSDSVSSVALRGEASKDLTASKIYGQVVSSRQRHIATHIEVEGLHDRVLAQLMLIETTLAGAIAQIVKITAADDEESSLTATLLGEQLELLMSDVKILEMSLEEVAQARIHEVEAISREG